MKLLISLRNPREKYSANRHNVGEMFVDWIVQNVEISPEVRLLKSEVFMNESGEFVLSQMNFYKVENEEVFIVHDDLDIPFGEFKIQFATGPKVHNGITSIEESLKTKDFWRVRIGIDNRDPLKRTQGKTYVLSDFTSEEEAKLKAEIFPKIWRELEKKLRE